MSKFSLLTLFAVFPLMACVEPPTGKAPRAEGKASFERMSVSLSQPQTAPHGGLAFKVTIHNPDGVEFCLAPAKEPEIWVSFLTASKGIPVLDSEWPPSHGPSPAYFEERPMTRPKTASASLSAPIFARETAFEHVERFKDHAVVGDWLDTDSQFRLLQNGEPVVAKVKVDVYDCAAHTPRKAIEAGRFRQIESPMTRNFFIAQSA